MIGMVIISHGALAKELIAATEHVVGPQDAVQAVCIGPDDDMEQRRADIEAAIKATNRGHGVLVFTDMFGGTPSNLAISLLNPGEVEVVAGVNLPMLIKTASLRGGDNLDETVEAVVETGRKYINSASAALKS